MDTIWLPSTYVKQYARETIQEGTRTKDIGKMSLNKYLLEKSHKMRGIEILSLVSKEWRYS